MGPQATGINVLSNTLTVFWYNREANNGNGFWLQFNEPVDVFQSPVANDPHGRVYYLKDGVLRYTTAAAATTGPGPYPSASYTVGIPTPTPPSAIGPSGEPPDGGQKVSTAYVMTFVNEYGEEGPPSGASNIVDRWDEGTVALSALATPSGSGQIVSKRLYRVELSGVFQYVAEIPAAQTTYNDSIDSESLGEPLPSANYASPETDLEGVLLLPNGIFMAWKKHTLMFSVPYQPHAWPVDYQITLDYDVVAAAVAGDGVVVTTKGKPYYVAGTSPEAIVQYKMDVVQSCVARRSMVDMGEHVLYASPDGLVMAGNAAPGVITAGDMTAEQWAQMKPETIHAYRWADRYLAFYDGNKCFTYHPQEGFLFYDLYADTAFLDELTGDLYIKQGTALFKWFKGEVMPYTWRTKVFGIAPSQPMLCCKVDAEDYPVTVEVYQDGVLTKTKSVVDRKPFYLPCRSRRRELELELTGSQIVNSIQIATSYSEIV